MFHLQFVKILCFDKLSEVKVAPKTSNSHLSEYRWYGREWWELRRGRIKGVERVAAVGSQRSRTCGKEDDGRRNSRVVQQVKMPCAVNFFTPHPAKNIDFCHIPQGEGFVWMPV